jgi:aryl-alcohol dehydrogenase-like predicted oxidoreductase
MDMMPFGKTGLKVSRSGFGALPIQRISVREAGLILRSAYDGGINFYDTARAYTDSEEKIGSALSDVRHNIIIASKTHAKDASSMRSHLEQSLKMLKTDYIDIYQFHNPDYMPDMESELYIEALKAKSEGKIRFIGITSHSLDRAKQSVLSGLYDSVQFPLSPVSSEKDLSLSELCKERNVGLIGMKALAGGLVSEAVASFVFLRQFDNILPIWGVQTLEQKRNFFRLRATPPSLLRISKALSRAIKTSFPGPSAVPAGTVCPATPE